MIRKRRCWAAVAGAVLILTGCSNGPKDSPAKNLNQPLPKVGTVPTPGAPAAKPDQQQQSVKPES
jgi:PBP1b-binding outer membrane lipoprotein LpoB